MTGQGFVSVGGMAEKTISLADRLWPSCARRRGRTELRHLAAAAAVM